MAGIKSQGTHLYFVDRTGAATLVKMTCPTGVTGATSGTADTIESTCLDDTEDKTYEKGLNNPTQVTVPFILDPADASHQLLHELKAAGDVLDWDLLFSDGTAPPTLGLTPDFALIPPSTRSGATFRGYIAEVTTDVGANDLVRGTLLIQRSGGYLPHWKA